MTPDDEENEPQSFDDLAPDEPVPPEDMSVQYKGEPEGTEDLTDVLEGLISPEPQVDLPLSDESVHEERLDLSND